MKGAPSQSSEAVTSSARSRVHTRWAGRRVEAGSASARYGAGQVSRKTPACIGSRWLPLGTERNGSAGLTKWCFDVVERDTEKVHV